MKAIETIKRSLAVIYLSNVEGFQFYFLGFGSTTRVRLRTIACTVNILDLKAAKAQKYHSLAATDCKTERSQVLNLLQRDLLKTTV